MVKMLVLPRFKESSRSLSHLCDEFFVVSSVLVFIVIAKTLVVCPNGLRAYYAF